MPVGTLEPAPDEGGDEPAAASRPAAEATAQLPGSVALEDPGAAWVGRGGGGEGNGLVPCQREVDHLAATRQRHCRRPAVDLGTDEVDLPRPRFAKVDRASVDRPGEPLG